MKDKNINTTNYDISENLILHIISGQDDKLFLVCDIYDNGIFNRVDFEIDDEKLKVVFISTESKRDKRIFYKLTINNVVINNKDVIITLDSTFKCSKEYSFNIKCNMIFNLDTISKSRYDIFDKLDNKFGLYYIKVLLQSKQLYAPYCFIYENVDKILEFVQLTEKPRIDFFPNNQRIGYDLEKCIKDAQAFLDEMNIKIDINNLVNDNLLLFKEDLGNNYLSGQSTFDKEENRRVIFIQQTNDLAMVAVLIHELIHYYNQPPDGNRTMASEFLTEVTSYGFELLFLDRYLQGKYQSDAKDMFRWMLNSLSETAYSTYAVVFSLKLYKENKLTIAEIEKNMNLDNYFREIKDFIKEGSTISYNLWNIIGYYLAIYSYIEYKKNPAFANKLLKLSHFMNDKSFLECLKIINLNTVDEALKKGAINLEKYADFVRCFENIKN